jgi:hypothetical protein
MLVALLLRKGDNFTRPYKKRVKGVIFERLWRIIKIVFESKLVKIISAIALSYEDKKELPPWTLFKLNYVKSKIVIFDVVE